MNRDRFFALLDAYGAEPRRWPEAERDAALAYAQEDPEAATRLRSAGALDGVLDESRPLAPSPALRRRLVEAAPRPARRRSPLRWAVPGAGLVAAGVAGLVFGAALQPPSDVQSDQMLADVDAYAYEMLGGVETTEGQL